MLLYAFIVQIKNRMEYPRNLGGALKYHNTSFLTPTVGVKSPPNMKKFNKPVLVALQLALVRPVKIMH